MKLTKRFLCLLLSLCMVFLAIPAFAFPITAAKTEEPITTSSPAYQSNPLDDGQKFVETGKNDPDDANAEISYPGAWEMIVYDKPADIENGKSALIDHYTTQNTATRAFLTAYKDYGAAKEAPVLVNHEASAQNGQDYSFLFNINSKAPKTPAAVGGYRYTAKYTGDIRVNFDKLAKDSGSYDLTAASFTEVRIAIFVDGVMVWPKAGADATDYANWCAPYSVPDDFVDLESKIDPVEGTDYYNQRDAINEQLKNLSLFVDKGSQVDFLITYASYVKAYPRTANSFLPAISYSEIVSESKPAYQPEKPQAPISIDNDGIWQIIAYDKPADIANSSNAALIDSYMHGYPTGSTGTNTFRVPYTYIDPTDGYTKAPVYVNDKASASWGHDNAFLFNMVGDTIPVAGYRYTAEYTGYIQAAFDELKRDYSTTGGAKLAADTFTGVRIAIFVDGVMVWPTANADDPSDLSKWEQPYSIPDGFTDVPGNTDPTGKYINHQAQINEELKDLPFYVREGSKVDFLITYTASVKTTDSKRSANFFRPAVSYSEVIESAKTVFVSYDDPATGLPVMIETTEGGTVILPVPDLPAGYALLGWDINGDGQVDYQPGATIQVDKDMKIYAVMELMDPGTSFYDNLPTYNEQNMTVHYRGGWQVGVYDRYGEKFMPYSDCIDKNSLLCNYGDAWNRWGGFYIKENPRFTMSTGLIPSGNFWSQIQYTTPVTGTISIDLKTLEGTENSSNTAAATQPLSFKIAIYKNGEKIWPAGNEWATVAKDGGSKVDLLDVLQAQYPDAFPLKVNVNAGDTIEFRAENQNDTSYMLAMNPSIYTALNEAPNVTATGVTVKETFTLNVYTHLNYNQTDYVASGLKYWTSLADAENKADNYKALSAVYTQDNTIKGAAFSDVTEMYSIKGISAWDLNKVFYVRTWVQYADGTIKDGDIVEISVSDYAQNAINKTAIDSSLNRIATALLQYTIAIEEYRGRDSGLTMPEKLPVMPVIKPKDVYNLTTLEGGKVTMKGATLVLGETIDLEIAFTTTLSKDRAEKLVVLMDDNASFLTPEKLQAVEGEDGIYRVTVKIRTVDFSKPFYFKVMDHRGDVQSGVLTYSVESYVARKYEQEPENEKLIALLNSMLVLCKTANDVR